MSNTSLGRGQKGSKYWMQLVSEGELKAQFDQLVGDCVTWLSPLESEVYREYELRARVICDALGIENSEGAFAFWPHRQPQWDGLAVSDETKTLYLVEAKAHLKELESSCAAKSKDSKDLIMATMQSVYNEYYKEGCFLKWEEGYYQLGNRLTFLHKMKDMNLQRYPNVKLVLLNFVDDYTYRPTSKLEWEEHYRLVFKEMTACENAPNDVSVIYIDVKD